ncbi:MAG: hypothetical protein ACPGGK_11340 [Pikeienuella sp.]
MKGHRGGAPVGYLEELSIVEAMAVSSLRMWLSGQETREALEADFGSFLPGDEADDALRALAVVCDLIARNGRRPMMRHGIECKCLGGDEAVFANLVAASAANEHADAAAFGVLLVKPDFAAPLTHHAGNFGRALMRANGMPTPSRISISPTNVTPTTLH